jgi:hypothetical protein
MRDNVFPARRARCTIFLAVLEKRAGLCIVPVVAQIFHQVDCTTGRHRLNAGHEPRASARRLYTFIRCVPGAHEEICWDSQVHSQLLNLWE